jgi:hypothetical protein
MSFFGSSWGEEWYGKNDERPTQYFMYGIAIPYKRYKEWEEGTGRKFPVGIYGNIFCMFDGRDGKYIIIGRVLDKTTADKPYLGAKEPLIVPELSKADEAIIKIEVYHDFNIEGEFHYYFITR